MNELCPIEIVFGNTDTLKASIRDCPEETVIISEYETCVLWGIAADIAQKADSEKALWIDRIAPNPTQRDVQDALRRLEGSNPAHIIAIGGGSTLDLAKAVSTFTYFFGGKAPDLSEITRAIESKTYRAPHRMIPITAAPSTAGTGSEMTCWATIWDEEKKGKYSIEDDALYAKKAVLIPELTLSLPPKLTVSTALDSLCHASEAFWAKTTTPVVKDLAVRAVDLIMGALPQALAYPGSLEARSLLMRGALLAGIAFSKTHTTACHSISYPITMLYGVPHGLACAFTLDAVSRINRPAIADSDMLFGTYEKYGGLRSWMDAVCGPVVSLRLRDYGIPLEGLDEITRNTFTKGRMDNNPVDLGPEQIRRILRDIY